MKTHNCFVQGNFMKTTRLSKKYKVDANTLKGKLFLSNNKGSFEDDNGNYSFGYTKDIDYKISRAIKKDKTIYNIKKGNYKQLYLTYVPLQDVYSINGCEYFIESKENEKGEIKILITSYKYGVKGFELLNSAFSNVGSLEKSREFLLSVESEMLEESNKLNIRKFNKIANAIHHIFNLCIAYHEMYQKVNYDNKYDLLLDIIAAKNYYNGFLKNYYKYHNIIFREFSDLYLELTEGEISRLRYFTVKKICNIKSEISQLYFQWGHSPFSLEIDEICTKLNNKYSDEILSKSITITAKEHKQEAPKCTVETEYFYNLPKTDSYNWIKQQGGQDINTNNDSCYCFSIGLATMLINDNLPVIMDNDKKTTIKGSIYIDSFYKGFVEGKKYFVDEFKNNQYQSQDTIKTTLDRYYNEEMIDGMYEGWKSFKDTTPRVLSYDNIKKYGYYNGVIFELKEFIKINKDIFSSSTIKDTQPSKEESKLKFNPSQFNKYTYNLFTYILENYTTKGIVKYINIWYFLKRHIPKKYKEVILFNFTQKEYKIFVKKEYKIEINKFKNSGDKFNDTEVGILHNCFRTYRDNLK